MTGEYKIKTDKELRACLNYQKNKLDDYGH